MISLRETTSLLRFPKHFLFFPFVLEYHGTEKATSGRIIKEGFTKKRKKRLTHSCMVGLKNEQMAGATF